MSIASYDELLGLVRESIAKEDTIGSTTFHAKRASKMPVRDVLNASRFRRALSQRLLRR